MPREVSHPRVGLDAEHLTTERELGRITADTAVDTLALTLIGAADLLFIGREGTPPRAGAVRKVVSGGHRRRRAMTAAMDGPSLT